MIAMMLMYMSMIVVADVITIAWRSRSSRGQSRMSLGLELPVSRKRSMLLAGFPRTAPQWSQKKTRQ